MEEQTSNDNAKQVFVIHVLGEEEEAWYRRDGKMECVAAIRQWIRQRVVVRSSSGNPLEDEEDAWVRP